jgi:hypothetical protein
MSAGGDDRIVARHHEQERQEREVVEALFRQALERDRERERNEQALIEQLQRETVNHDHRRPPPRGVHHTELPEARPGEPLASEWNTYRREVRRLLAEGQEGRHVLIKGEEIVGLFETFEAAAQAGAKRFPGGPFFVHPVRTEEPYLRIRGINCPWPNSISR